LAKVLVPYRELDRTAPYVRALEMVNLHPVLANVSGRMAWDGCSGLLLLGGTDVNPFRYNEPPHAETDPPDDERDAGEADLLRHAIAHDMPVLAICRGMQMLNVHLGGTLVQHLRNIDRHRRRTPENPGMTAHPVRIEPGTMLARIAGREDWQVNSRHHQAPAKLGEGLRISARDPHDGTIEAVEYPSRRFLVAVQWHPEDQVATDTEQRKLFRAFAEAL
jgi:putative glutamine amidotransferase